MKVVFYSKFYPHQNRDEYMKNSRAGLAFAADAHQYAIALGLNSVCREFDIINVPALYPFPLRYKKMYINGGIINENGLKINNIPYFNVKFFQGISRYIQSKSELEKMIHSSSEIVYILVYATSLPTLKCATDLRMKYSNVRISLIVPDLPEHMQHGRAVVNTIYKKIEGLFWGKFEDYKVMFDSYVLLSKYMRDTIPCNDNNYIINEGVYNESTSPRIIQQQTNGLFRIFYSGMMYHKFGVMNLVNAVHSIDNPNIELLLCGFGDTIGEIKKLSAKDSRIKYIGIISREEALEMQTKSSLLVNPRIPDKNPYTRYSFPSKTMEYLSSGTPALIYQLDGIPDEYFKYCYSLDKNHCDINSLTSKIIEIINIPLSKRNALGLKAREFILNEKNSLVAGKKIYELLKKTI